jgi:hypothetical protein
MASSKVEKSSPTHPKKTGGRKKGTPNKKTDHIFDLCAEHEFDPIELLILIAKNDCESLGYRSNTVKKIAFGGQVVDEERITIADRRAAAKDLISHMYPKRKAVELSAEDKDDGFFKLSYDTQKLKDKLNEK